MIRRLVWPSVVVIVAACSSGEGGNAGDTAAVERADSARSVEAPPVMAGASSTGESTSASVTPRPAPTLASLAADSIGITSRSGAVLLSLAQDTVSLGLSSATLDKVKRETDTAGTASGIAGMIERTVKSGVQSMLKTRMKVPVDDIESVQYRDGGIRFTYRRPERAMKLEDVKVDNKPVLESFSEADARLFVTAVRARLRR